MPRDSQNSFLISIAPAAEVVIGLALPAKRQRATGTEAGKGQGRDLLLAGILLSGYAEPHTNRKTAEEVWQPPSTPSTPNNAASTQAHNATPVHSLPLLLNALATFLCPHDGVLVFKLGIRGKKECSGEDGERLRR